MRKLNFKKVLFGLSVSLVLAMAVGSFAIGDNQTPANPQVETRGAVNAPDSGAFTVTATDGETVLTDNDYSYSSGVLTIKSTTPMTIKNTDPTTSTTDRIEVTGGATVTLEGVNIDNTTNGPALTISGSQDVTILIADGSKNVLKGKAGSSSDSNPGAPGIQKTDSASGWLIIGVPENSERTTGELEATGGYRAAGVGGGYQENGSNIKITGGKVTATGGGFGGAGIGGGDSGSGSYITITGGNITATGISGGAGIGGGDDGNGSNITISGGTVTSNANVQAAGIGGGRRGSGSDITISGNAEVTATGANYAAGIGGGDDGNGSNITINGGTVTATGGDSGAGIGGGRRGSGSDITISGGVVTATGGSYGAGIGGGDDGNGSNIKITGGEVIAEGGNSGAGIGGGQYKNGTKITINNSTVTATGGGEEHARNYLYTAAAAIGGGGGSLKDDGTWDTNPGIGSENQIQIDDSLILIAKGGIDAEDYSKETLEGFDEASGGSLAGIIFEQKIDSEVNAGTVYGDIVLTNDLTMPTNATLTIPQDNSLTINESKTLTVPAGSVLTNEGTLTIKGNIDLSQGGEITTKTNFYLTDGSKYGDEDYYQTYQTSEGVQKYKDLPNPDDTTLLKNSLNSDKFIYWYYLNGSTEVKIGNSKDVEPNQHDFYEKRATAYAVTIPQLQNGSVTSDVTEAYSGDTVTLTVTPAEGYELQENSLKVMAGTTSVTVTKGADGKYTFTMPNAAVTVSAVFEGKTHEISIDQPEHGTVELDKDTAKVGDEVGFTLTPDDGYELKEVKVTDKDGNEIQVTEKDGKYTFKMPDSEVKIIATFEGKSHEVTIDQPEDGTITVDPENPRTGDEVTITLKPEEGYKPGGAPVVKDEEGNEIELTPTGNPGEYKFIMPNSNLTIDVNFVPDSTPTPPGPGPGPEPTPTPEPTPDPSVNPDGDGSGSGASSKTGDSFAGVAALALLGVATTGAVLVRKRK